MKSLTNYDDILKTDALGRIWTPVARRESLLDEFEHSGLSGAKFAALVGVKYQTFVSWVHKRRRRKSGVAVSEDSQSRGELQWLEAVVEPRSDRDGSECTARVTSLDVCICSNCSIGAATWSVNGRTFCILATRLFGDTYPQWFGTLGGSLYPFFQIMTLESRSMEIVRPLMETHFWAWLFFVPLLSSSQCSRSRIFSSGSLFQMCDHVSRKMSG